MLRAMQTGASGFARLECEGGRTRVQINARGLKAARAQAFWYTGGEAARLGDAPVNPHGEMCLSADAPASTLAPCRLQALIVLSEGARPAPLLIGLCVPQSAGSLLDAKNAALTLCDKLGRTQKKNVRAVQHRAAAPLPRAAAQPDRAACKPPAVGSWAGGKPPQERQAESLPALSAAAARVPSRPSRPEVPPEIFLPAIDPLPYVQAGDAPHTQAAEAAAPVPQAVSTADSAPQAMGAPEGAPPPRSAPPADRLRPLRWPRAFLHLRQYFDVGMPCRLFAAAGWRYVRAADGLWLGYLAQDGRVAQVAYAYAGAAPPAMARECRPMRGVDGQMYRVLWQKV